MPTAIFFFEKKVLVVGMSDDIDDDRLACVDATRLAFQKHFLRATAKGGINGENQFQVMVVNEEEYILNGLLLLFLFHICFE